MATCATNTTIYAFATSGTNTKTGYAVPILSGSPPCATLVVMTQAEYAATTTATQTNTTQDTSIAGHTTSINNLQAAVVALQGGGGYSVNPDVITAETTIFGIVLGAAAVIWGLKQVYRTLTDRLAHE